MDMLGRISCGDCIVLMKDMDDNEVNLTVTDIPYGVVNRDSNGLRNLDKRGGIKQHLISANLLTMSAV